MRAEAVRPPFSSAGERESDYFDHEVHGVQHWCEWRERRISGFSWAKSLIVELITEGAGARQSACPVSDLTRVLPMAMPVSQPDRCTRDISAAILGLLRVTGQGT